MIWRSTRENTQGTNLISVVFVERNLCRLVCFNSTLDTTITVRPAGWVPGCAHEGAHRGDALQMPGE